MTFACSSDDSGTGAKILDGGGGGNITPDDGSAGTGGKASVGSAKVGRACVRDIDCAAQGLTCLTPASSEIFGGGPAGGLCAADCSADPTICQKLDTNSICVSFSDASDGPAYCLEACTVGASGATTTKCHGRVDMACDDQGSPTVGDGFCRPTCRSDADCGDRKCGLGTGLCVDASEITGTLPIGSPCDPNATKDPCSGVCVPLTQATNGPGMCGGLCTLGAPGGCGADTSSSEPPAAVCLFGLTDATPDSGDLGLCGQLCNCDSECKASGRVCRPFTADGEADQLGFPGYCGGSTDTDGATADHIAACSGVKPDAGKPTPKPDAGAALKDASPD
jgi:hypothetical protein